MSSLKSLIASPASGRTRPVLIDHTDYATAVIRQGQPIPWADLAALTGHQGQVHALLDPDATWLDVGAVQGAHLVADPELVAAMGARSRTGYALRTLLADEDGVAGVQRTAKTLADAARRPLVLSLPSPARWLGRAHGVAGTGLDEIDPDRADMASTYIAEWLGKLSELPVALVLLDARARVGDPIAQPESVSDYSAITNIASHLDWVVALRTDDQVETSDSTTISLLPEGFWSDDDEIPAGDALLTGIPASAQPERVLEKLARLA